MTHLRRALLAFAAPLLLAGCLDADPVNSPTEFLFTSGGGSLDGTYNPTGFTAAEVRKQIAQVCNTPELASYREARAPDGLVRFSAECRFANFFDSATHKVSIGALGPTLTTTEL